MSSRGNKDVDSAILFNYSKSMNFSYNENAFREWLIVRKNLSKKASGDVVSRLNRSLRIESIDGHETFTSYLDALLQNPLLDTIPLSSRASMNRAAKLFFEFNFK
jgi:hypothetical protein